MHKHAHLAENTPTGYDMRANILPVQRTTQVGHWLHRDTSCAYFVSIWHSASNQEAADTSNDCTQICLALLLRSPHSIRRVGAPIKYRFVFRCSASVSANAQRWAHRARFLLAVHSWQSCMQPIIIIIKQNENTKTLIDRRQTHKSTLTAWIN